jgi:hypothetical protein
MADKPNSTVRLTEKDLRRFMSKISPEPMSGCWLWEAGLNKDGYGVFGLGGRAGRMYLAHRVAYMHFIGEIPDGLVLDHTCRNPCCCSPWHSEPVTQLVNVLRGNAGQRELARTHCPKGHEYTPENTMLTTSAANGKKRRECKTCAAARLKAWRDANPGLRSAQNKRAWSNRQTKAVAHKIPRAPETPST